jgi:hypothetical protein
VAAYSCAGVIDSALSSLVVNGSGDVDPEQAAPAAATATIHATTKTFRPVNMTQT